MLKIVFNGAVVFHLRDLLLSKLSRPAAIIRLSGDESEAERAAACADADVLVAIRNVDLPVPPRLQLLQVPGAGLDQIDLAKVPPQAYVCNAYGHDIAAGEYVVLGMLAWCHQFLEAHESFKGGSWRLSGRFGAPLHEELHGKTVAVLGLGSIGLAVARLAKAFGTTILAVNRTLRERPPFVDEVHGLDRLHDVLGRADFVAVCLAQSPQTTGLLDRRALASMRRDGVLINIARGAIVDESALYESLRDRIIGGAVIDAWYDYPAAGDVTARPSRLPFHDLQNLIMTPHSAVWTRGMIERRWTTIAANVDAIADGDPSRLQHLVRPPAVALGPRTENSER